MRPSAVIVDVDGTLCDIRRVRHFVEVRPKNFDAFHAAALDCPPNPVAVGYCRTMHELGHQICIVTARKYRWEEQTREYARRHLPGIPFHGPYMRGDDDNRRDVEVKRDIYDVLCEQFEVVGAIDDNEKILELWKSLKIPTVAMPITWSGA